MCRVPPCLPAGCAAPQHNSRLCLVRTCSTPAIYRKVLPFLAKYRKGFDKDVLLINEGAGHHQPADQLK